MEEIKLQEGLLTGAEGVATTLDKKELVAYLEHNRYYQNRAELRQFAREKKVDMGVAVAMFRSEKGWKGLWVTDKGGDLESESFLQAFRDAENLEEFWA